MQISQTSYTVLFCNRNCATTNLRQRRHLMRITGGRDTHREGVLTFFTCEDGVKIENTFNDAGIHQSKSRISVRDHRHILKPEAGHVTATKASADCGLLMARR